jgi:hypothetical protein
MGQWLAKSKSENSKVILTDYLEAALKIAHEGEVDADAMPHVCKAHYSLAKFADEQYKLILERKNTVEYQEARRIKLENRAELEHLQHAERERSDKDAFKRLTVGLAIYHLLVALCGVSRLITCTSIVS